MGIKTAEIAVYPVDAFGNANANFWMGDLEKILVTYPFLELPHRHNFYMLIYIEDALGEVTIDGAAIKLDQSKVIFIKPNSVFSLDINSKGKGKVVCFTDIFFSLRYNNNVLYQFAFFKKNAVSFIRLAPNQAQKWQYMLAMMQAEFLSLQKSAEKVLRSYVNILLYDLDRWQAFPAVKVQTGSKEERMIYFEKLLEQHYIQHKTPSFYAHQLNISTNYLNKICQECMGVTGGEIIRKRITLEAQRLLHYTALSVAEIGYKLGFDNPSYFITFFKKNTGITPEGFRKNSFV